MWNVIEGPIPVEPLGDHQRYLFIIERQAERREAHAEISGTAAACDPVGLPSPIGAMVTTRGRTAVERYLSDPPAIVRVHSEGWEPIYHTRSWSSA